jgi:collagenase-like PrtC family protease
MQVLSRHPSSSPSLVLNEVRGNCINIQVPLSVKTRAEPVQDLMALDSVPDMMRAGVSCFKIEGRMKGPEYVAITTAAYRAAVDSAWAQLVGEPASSAKSTALISEQQRRALHQVRDNGGHQRSAYINAHAAMHYSGAR